MQTNHLEANSRIILMYCKTIFHTVPCKTVLSILFIAISITSCNPNSGSHSTIEDVRHDLLESIELPTLIKIDAPDKKKRHDLLGRVKQYTYSSHDISNSEIMSIKANMSSAQSTWNYDESGQEIAVVTVEYQNTTQYPDWDKMAPDTIYENWEYDQNGRIFKHFSQRQRRKTYVENRYREDGQLLEKISRNAFGRIFEVSTNTYDKDDRIVESISKEPEGRIDTRCLYKYDLNGRTEEYQRFALTDDVLESKDISRYNSKNQQIKREKYWEIAEVSMKKRIKPNLGLYEEANYEYNAEGYLAKSNTVFYDRKSSSQIITKSTAVSYTYDNKGNITSKRFVNNDGSASTSTYSYNGNRKVLKEQYDFFPDSNSSEKEGYEYVEHGYDKMGNRTKKETYISAKDKKTSLTYEYKYDSIGNWTERVTLENGSPERISKQEIQYYQNSTSTSDLLATAEENFNSDEFEKSVQQYSAILNLKGQVTTGLYYNRATSKFMLNDFRGAISDYSSELELNPNSIDAYYYRGIAAICIAKKDSGCADLSKAGELGHSDAYEIISKFCQ